jgi:hypothetical protein
VTARRAPFRQVDVQRAVRGAIAGAAGSGKTVRIELEGGRITITPVDGATTPTEAAELERRMVEAFGE